MQDHGTTSIGDSTVEHGNTVSKPEQPIDDDYIFIGWYTDTNFTSSFNFEAGITENTTAVAKWALKKTVTFYGNGGTVSKPTVIVGQGQKLLAKDLPTASFDPWVFKTWYTDEACTVEWDFNNPVNDDMPLYAGWDTKCSVTFDMQGHGDQIPQKTNLPKDSYLGGEPKPTAFGYTFVGWYTDTEWTTKIDFANYQIQVATLTLYAKWEPKMYTVSYNMSGKAANPIASIQVQEGTTFTLPENPTVKGYTFVRWYTDSNFTTAWNSTNQVTSDTTLYAKWNTKYFTVSHDLMGYANNPATVNVQEGNTHTPSTVYISGYEFIGWYKDSNYTNAWTSTDTVNTNITLYAKYEPKTYSVTLNSNIQNISNGSANVVYKTKSLSNIATPVVENGTIEGWYDDATFSNKVADSNGTLLSNVTSLTNDQGEWIRSGVTNLYARWNFTVTFEDPYDFSPTDFAPVTVLQGEKVTAPDISSLDAGEGYTYVWIAEDANNEFNFDSAIKKPTKLVLYKSYDNTDNKYTVNFLNSKNVITGYNGLDADLIIPAAIEGKKIYAIFGKYTSTDSVPFGGKTTLRSVVISEGIEMLYDGAFRSCTSLESVSIPASITRLGNDKCGVFARCSNLTDVRFAEGSRIDKFEKSLFSNCTKLTSITIPDSVTKIYTSVFDGTGITSLNIPANVEYIESGNFISGCNNLTTITVDPNNQHYKAVDGNSIYSKDGKQLIAVSNKLTSFTIKEGTEEIGEGCFNFNYTITEIIIPEGVKTIKDGAFWYTGNLTSIVLPSTLETIEESNFYGNYSLTEIRVKATQTVNNSTVMSLPASCKVYIPASAESYYRNATNWRDVSGLMVTY